MTTEADRTTGGGGKGEEEDDGGRRVPVQRLLSLTDGVATIAMTLLVLDIEIPDGLDDTALQEAFHDSLAQVATFLLSVVVIALFWRGHHMTLRRVEHARLHVFWLTIAFLALLSLIPFPTQVLQEYNHLPLGPALYATVVGLAALMLYATHLAVAAERPEAAAESWSPAGVQALVFLGSAGVAFVSPTAAVWCWLATVPLGHLAHRAHLRRHHVAMRARAARKASRPGVGSDGDRDRRDGGAR